MTTTPPPPGDMPPPQAYAPQPMLESEARTMSMLTHLLTLLLGFISPLIFWLIYRERSALVDHHGKEQLNFQITLTIYYVVLYGLTFLTLGFGAILTVPLIFVVMLYALVMIIMAAVAANRGEYFRIALNIRFIS